MDSAPPSMAVKSFSRSRRKPQAGNEAVEQEDIAKGRELLDNWREHVETALEVLVLENITAAIEIGTRKLVVMGYSAEESLRAIAKCSGECKSVARIVENAVEFLRSGGTVGNVGQGELEDFQVLVLEEMVRGLRRDRPSLLRGDALWEILLADINISSCIEVLLPIKEEKVDDEDEAEEYIVEEEETTSDPSNDEETLDAASRDSHSSEESLSSEEEETLNSEHERNRKAQELVRQRFKISDELVVKLNASVKELQSQLEERTEWAHAKVLQAAQRLSKDFNELKRLRAEHEETNEKYSELESSLRKSIAELDQAKARHESLEAENAAMRAEVEAAKLFAAESVASSLEVSKQEKSLLQKSQALEKQRAKLQEELAAEKRKSASIKSKKTTTRPRLEADKIQRPNTRLFRFSSSRW